MPSDDLFTKEDVLSGLPAKRARTLLFLLENRVGLLAAKSKRVVAPLWGGEAVQELETAFLDAFSAGRNPPEPPTVIDMERFAQDWAPLVPDSPRLRAALAHLLSEKYVLPYRDVPKIRTAIGLDQESVQRSFETLYQRPLSSIYRDSPSFLNGLRWTFSRFSDRINSLPPFWTSFSLTLTETVGAAILALPIALAKVGPVMGGLLLIGFGLLNVVTIGLMAEAIVRSGTIRYGNAFLGRVLADYFGPAASIVLSTGLGLICFLLLQAYYIGVSTTLADTFRISPGIIAAALFAVGIYYMTRKSLTSTVASALAVGGVNMAIILFISAMAFGKLNPKLYTINAFSTQTFDPSFLELIFGVILTAYFGHLSISNCARIVLRRDPSGRSLIWGAMASMFLTIIVYSVWVIAVNGSVEPGAFEGLPGTAFTPLAAKIGPVVTVLGSVFVILGMGMASIHFSLGLFNIVRERLPSRKALTLVLPRRNGMLIFRHRGRKARTGPRIGLIYIGLKGSISRFLLEVQSADGIYREEIDSHGTLKLDRILERFEGASGTKTILSIEVLEAESEFSRLQCNTSLSVVFEGDLEPMGMTMAEVVDLPEEERKLLNLILRKGKVNLYQAAALMKTSHDKALEALKNLADRGFILRMEESTGPTYRGLLATRRGRRLPDHIWDALDQKASSPKDLERGSSFLLVGRLKSFLFSEQGRFGLCISPIVIAFLLTEWMLYTGSGSFSGVLNFVGIIAVPLLGGIFPVLMLVSSRRKGEYIPQKAPRFFGSPILLTGIYVLFLASPFVYGLFIYRELLTRVAVLAVGLFVPFLTIQIIRNKGFSRRAVIELRRTGEKEKRSLFQVMSGGKPLEVEVGLIYKDGMKTLRSSGGSLEKAEELKGLVFTIPAHGARELKVLAYSIGSDGSSSSLEGTVEVHGNGESQCFELKLMNGSLLLPIDEKSYRVTFTLQKADPSALMV